MKIKVYLLLGLSLLAAFLGLKVMSGKITRLKKKVELAEARVDHVKKVAQGQKDNEVVYRSRTTELAKDLEDRRVARELEKPNEKW